MVEQTEQSIQSAQDSLNEIIKIQASQAIFNSNRAHTAHSMAVNAARKIQSVQRLVENSDLASQIDPSIMKITSDYRQSETAFEETVEFRDKIQNIIDEILGEGDRPALDAAEAAEKAAQDCLVKLEAAKESLDAAQSLVSDIESHVTNAQILVLSSKNEYDSAWSTQNKAYETQGLDQLQSLISSIKVNIGETSSAMNSISQDHQST